MAGLAEQVGSVLSRLPGPIVMYSAFRHARLWCAIIDCVIHVVRVAYVVEQDEDGAWCASARLRPGVAAFGEGPTREAAIADLHAGLGLLLDVVYGPGELARHDSLPLEAK